MSFRTNLLKTVNNLRALSGPTGFDVYTSRVTIRVRTWTGGDNGPEVRLGSYTDVDTEILPRPKVREAGGGTGLVVGPITPANDDGGYTPAQLNPAPSLTAGQEVLYVVEGPNGTFTYTAADIDTSRAFRYMLTLTGLERKIPY